jgi:hypothetical protein
MNNSNSVHGLTWNTNDICLHLQQNLVFSHIEKINIKGTNVRQCFN